MTDRPSYTHVFHLILELRQAALENGEAALAREDGGFGLCLGAALANDAADALEALLAERPAAGGQGAVTAIGLREDEKDRATPRRSAAGAR